MSDQSYASPTDPYWLSSRGVNSVSFNKQATDPLAYLNKGILYEKNDGILYFNGVPLSGGGSGDVSGPASSDDNALARFDGATGKIIQNSNLILEDGSGDSVVLSGRPSASNLPMLLCTDSTQKVALGLRVPQDSSLGIASTAIGSSAMEATSGAQYCTAIGANALFQCDGDGNIAIGVDSALNYTGSESNCICIDSRGVLGDQDCIRIGDTQTDCFIQGIRGSTPALVSPEMVIVDTAGKLSSQAIPSGGLTLAGASSDTGSMVLYAGVPGEVAAGNLSLNTVGNQITFTDSVSGNFLKTTANESVYLGVSAGNGFAGTTNTAIGGSAMSSHNGGSSNTAVGGFALSAKTTASGNTIYGASAAQNLLTGNSNVVIGASAGSAYTTNESNNIVVGNGVSGVIADSAVIRIGSDTQTSCFIAREFKSNGTTLKIGNQSGTSLPDSNSTSRCTLVGNQTGISLVAQTDVTAVGDKAARYCTGSSNTVVGGGSLAGISATGANNAILGFNCAPASTSAQGNVIMGTNGGLLISTAATNTLVGNSVAPVLSTGTNNICIGAGSGGTLTTGSNNILIAANAPTAATATSIIIGSSTHTSTSIGVDFRSNNTITRVGFQAGNVATGTQNCCVGSTAGLAITTATGNTLVGSGCGAGLTGSVNTVVGAQSLDLAGTQANNTVVGATSARVCTSNDNVILGHSAAQQLSTGASNIIIGKNAGLTLATGSNNVYVAASAAVAAEAGTIRIGTAATQTRAFISGISGTTTGGAAVACLVDANGQLGTVSSSRSVKQNIRPIESTDWLHRLELCNFEYINGTVLSEDPESPDYNKKQKQVGVIAEDILLIKPELVIMQGNGILTVDYNALYVCALKELQKMRIDYDSLAARVAALEI